MGDMPQTGEPISRSEPGPEPHSEPPGEAWQKVARSIAAEAKERLWERQGKRALKYLTLGRGLVALWGIKVRRAVGEQRYQQVGGGNIKGCLYLADQIQPGLPLVLAEGEFDALTALQIG